MFLQRYSKSFVARTSMVVFLLLCLCWAIVRSPDWRRAAVVGQASHVVVSVRRPDATHYLFRGASSRELGEFIFNRSRPFFEPESRAYPISAYFFDEQERCIYSCRLSAGDLKAAEEFVGMASQGAEITETDLDNMITNTDYEKDTRRFK